MPPLFWVEALQTSTFLLNRKPCKPRSMATPFSLLFNTDPDYASLRIFGCLCYPNIESTSPNKLSPRSVACVFIGYSQDHHGYRCYNLTTQKVLTSRHVHFDEAVFPYRSGPATSSPTSCAYDPWRPDLSDDVVLPPQIPDPPSPRSPRAPSPRSPRAHLEPNTPRRPDATCGLRRPRLRQHPRLQ
jgi:histone deacetylase 1/2